MNINTSIYNFMREFHAKDDQVAVIYGNRKMRYKEFFKEVDRVAAGLCKLGVKQGDIVMIALPNIVQSVVATYAVARIGAIASMIHPKYSPTQFGAAVKKQHPKVVFLSEVNFFSYSIVSDGAKLVLCSMFSYSYIGLPRGKEFLPYEATGEEPVLLMHSGGTSGEPKTIVLSSRAVNAMAGNLLLSLGDRFGEKDAMLVALPMFHGFGLCVGVHAAASSNMALVLHPKFNVGKIIKSIEKNHVTTLIAVPRMVKKLLDSNDFAGERIASIKDVFVGGDDVGLELVRRFEKRMKESGGKATLSPGYGLTETVSVCAVSYDGYVEGSLGKPLKDVEIRIVDDNMNEVPLGEAGELLVSTPQIMIGYFGDKVATKKTFVEIDGKKWLKTGDIFRTDKDNNLFFLGRKKRLIKISGMNVFPNEIERVAQKLDFVKDCVMIESKQDGKTIVKMLTEQNFTKEEEDKIREYIRVKLSHWSVPTVIERIKELPRTDIGKVDVKLLQERENAKIKKEL
ncbi:MAG: acyl--CoA ligase [Clostridia bacterium]|nr:acyl--CoA ligase [Clostridia bacterium]